MRQEGIAVDETARVDSPQVAARLQVSELRDMALALLRRAHADVTLRTGVF